MTNEYYMSFSNEDLLRLEDSLDYRNPDLWDEIFRRAEDFEPGITDALYQADRGDSSEDSDAIFDRARKYLGWEK